MKRQREQRGRKERKNRAEAEKQRSRCREVAAVCSKGEAMKENTFYKIGCAIIVIVAVLFAAISVMSEQQIREEERLREQLRAQAEAEALTEAAEATSTPEPTIQMPASNPAPITVHIVNPELGKVYLESGELKDGEVFETCAFLVSSYNRPVDVMLEMAGQATRSVYLEAGQQYRFEGVRASGEVTVTFTSTGEPTVIPIPTVQPALDVNVNVNSFTMGRISFDDVRWIPWETVRKGLHSIVVTSNGTDDVRVAIHIDGNADYYLEIPVDEYVELLDVNVTGDITFSFEKIIL